MLRAVAQRFVTRTGTRTFATELCCKDEKVKALVKQWRKNSTDMASDTGTRFCDNAGPMGGQCSNPIVWKLPHTEKSVTPDEVRTYFDVLPKDKR